MAISAATVKELREMTGAGMMDCQRALAETNGDMDEAVKVLRKKGLAAAAQEGRARGQGRSGGDRRRRPTARAPGSSSSTARPTSWPAREQYQAFAAALAEQALGDGANDVEVLKADPLMADPLHTVSRGHLAHRSPRSARTSGCQRVASMQAGEGMQLGSYLHMGGKIGVLVEIGAAADEETVKDVAMHVAAAEPRFVSRDGCRSR